MKIKNEMKNQNNESYSLSKNQSCKCIKFSLGGDQKNNDDKD